MRTIYECEICGSTYLNKIDCKKCEAQSSPKIPEFLKNKVGQIVPGFGETGIGFGKFNGVYVLGPKHELYANATHTLSHNQKFEDGGFFIEGLDPRVGYDFLRYIDPDHKEFKIIVRQW